MATSETIDLNETHAPHPNALQAFQDVKHDIQIEILKSRHHWDKHQPEMWSRARSLSDEELATFHPKDDLVEVRSAVVSYGTILLGKLRIPAVKDSKGEGFVHVRIHDTPGKPFTFHSIFTDERDRDADGHPRGWEALQTRETPLEFFNE